MLFDVVEEEGKGKGKEKEEGEGNGEGNVNGEQKGKGEEKRGKKRKLSDVMDEDEIEEIIMFAMDEVEELMLLAMDDMWIEDVDPPEGLSDEALLNWCLSMSRF